MKSLLIGVLALCIPGLCIPLAASVVSIPKAPVAVDAFSPDGTFSNSADIVRFGQASDWLSGIATSALTETGDFVPPEFVARVLTAALLNPVIAMTGAVSGMAFDIQNGAGGEAQALSFAGKLADLSTSRASWLIAFVPWVWSLVIWHSRPSWRRRVRRNRR